MQLTVPSPSGQTLAGFSSAAACLGPAHSIPYTYRIPSQLLIECEQRQKIPFLMGKQNFSSFYHDLFRVCARLRK